MKHFIKILTLCFCFITNAHAFELEDTMFLTQHFLSYTTSFDISTKDKKLGTLYRRYLSIPTSYDFYDTHNQLITTATSHFFSFGAHLDVYDQDQQLLGMVEEKVFSFLPSFDIYSPDSLLLARASLNFWGTTFTLYDGLSPKVLALMTRPLFRLKNDWTITIKNSDRIREKNIDARLLMTVLAVQGDLEYLRRQRRNQQNNDHHRQLSQHTPNDLDQNTIQHLLTKIASLIENQNLDGYALMDQQHLNELSQTLDADFQQRHPNASALSMQELSMLFINDCFSKLNDDSELPENKKAIAYLLQQRLNSDCDNGINHH